MDFDDTPEEAAFRGKARAWLEANAPKTPSGRFGGPEHLAAARAWQAKKAAAGYAQIAWPKEWGGGGGNQMQAVIFAQEEARYGQTYAYFRIGLGMCIPTVMAFADDDTKTRFVGPAVRGEEIWCQLFSEPSGGSDVAAVRTRAVRDGEDWVINGQKVWTSGAQFCDFGIILVRTDPDKPKHKGMTMFWIDMTSPGVEVRPIHQMSGGHEFNEVYFTDVRVKDSQRLGEVGDGWRVALVTLMNERLAVSDGANADYSQILALARTVRTDRGTMLEDQAFREKLADWYVQGEGLKLNRMRTMTALSRGQTPGPENAIGKVIAANQLQDMCNQAIELEDQYGVVDDRSASALAQALKTGLLWAPGFRIAGGTDEILKNIIAERVLGLPGEVRVDKEVAFKDLPTGR